ncbi:MAG TPA: HD domain-containing protein [Anaerolineae bacterium]|nr:HD domain-containing protein [Anaerolineae bacterium]
MTHSTLDNPLLHAAHAVCRERGVRVWLAGGAVRDWVLGRPAHDWDLAVERDAIALARATANRLQGDVYVLDAGHDTARVIVAGVPIDFAGLRGRTLEADLIARDFTINAMAIDLDQPDRVIDVVNGLADVDAGVIRAIGEHSLTDDPIRLLRAVRQSAALAFEIDPQTARWIAQHAALIETESAERVRDELIKTLGEPGLADNLLVLEAFGLLAHVLPEVTALRGVEQSLPHHWDVFEHTRRVIDALELLGTRWLGFDQADDTAIMREVIPAFAWDSLLLTLAQFADSLRAHLQVYQISEDRSIWHTLKWTALLHDIGKPATRTVEDGGPLRTRFFGHEAVGAKLAEVRLRALKFSGDEINRVTGIIGGHMRPHQLADAGVSRRAIYRFFRDTQDYGVDILLLSVADHLATHGPDLDQTRWVARLGLVSDMLTAYFVQRDEIVLPPPLIDGNDLMRALGLKPGKQIGVMLEAIREGQAAGEVATKDEALTLARSLVRNE